MSSSTPLLRTPKKKLNHVNDKSVTFSAIQSVQEDEVERRHRRSQADIQRRLSAVGPQGSPYLNASANVNVDEVKEHFKLCQKLFVENKINSNNVWNLKLIDYLKILVSQDLFGRDTMLMAATSLDICAKVYACRVDDVYDKGLKLASTIASLERGPIVEDDGDVNDNGFGDNDNKKNTAKKKKKIKRLSASHKNTIAKDPESLLLSEIPEMPTTFFMGYIDVDASSTDNLFTNRLPLDHMGYKIVLLDTPNSLLYDTVDHSVQQNAQFLLPPFALQKLKICHLFSEFCIDEWDPDQEEAQFESSYKVQEKHNEVLLNDEVVFDEQGIPIAELDGSIHDNFAVQTEDDIDVNEEECERINAQEAYHQIEFISSFCPNENGFRLSRELDPWWMKRIWVGPSHWKNKFLKQRTSRFTGRVNNQAAQPPPKSRRKTKPISDFMDFENPPPSLDFSRIYKPKKLKCDVEKVTLPRNYIATMPDMNLLMSMPQAPEREYQAKLTDEEYEHSPYDYDNPNDSQYCSQHSVQEDLEENREPGLDTNFSFQTVMTANCERANGNITDAPEMLNSLVDAPEMVPQTYIPYALRAKKMNMKKLKNVMWELLTKHDDCRITINIEGKQAKDMMFSHLYGMLPAYLPESMYKELTPHLAFVSLLHLTNECNLKLTGQKDLHDIRVQQG